MWDVGLKVGAEAPVAVVERLDGGTVNIVGTDRRVAYTGVGDDQDIDAVLAKLGTP